MHRRPVDVLQGRRQTRVTRPGIDNMQLDGLKPSVTAGYELIVNHHARFTALFRDHPGELVLEENFCTLWCKGRLTEAGTQTIRLGDTPSRLTSAHLHHPPIFTGRMPFLPPNQQCQGPESN